MINLLIGKKGTGKTKKLVELANNAVAKTNGGVVVIEKGTALTYDLDHNARLVDVDAYGVNSYDVLYGFISGICAGNYDLTDIFVDSTFKICETKIDGLAEFVNKLNTLKIDANIVLLISADKSELPSELQAFCGEI